MKEFYWSATKVNVANYGTCRYYLRYMLGMQPLRLSAYIKGSHLHSLVENFWKRLGTPEEIRRNKKGTITSDKKYSSAEEFAEFAQRKWMRIVVADRDAEEKVTWRFEDEKYVIKNQLREICIPLFSYLSQIGPPILAEFPFDFEADDEHFKGRIDEIRKSKEGQVIIFDYKSGKPWVGDMKLANDPQLTLYNVGLCARLKFDPKLRQLLGLEGKLDSFMAGGDFTSPNIRVGFFMIESLSVDPESVKTLPPLIYESRRTDENFLALLKMVKSVRKRASEGDVYPESGKKCDLCDMKHRCTEEMKKVNKGVYFDRQDNAMFDFAAPAYARKEPVNGVSFAATEDEAEKPLTRSELNKIQPRLRLRYPKPEEKLETPALDPKRPS